MAVDRLLQSYQETPYPSLCYTQTHPDRLATLATLLGLQPTPVRQCRVLELGCAAGGNLIPMAYGLPDSEFVGADFSALQIEMGQSMVDALGLDNVTLLSRDILEMPSDFGRFDYIIAHGVYSWVPSAVRDKLLAICKQCLAPNGIAYVSYNTYPGWHMLGALREMMLYHTRQITDPHERVAQARTLLQFLADSVPGSDDPYGTFLDAYSHLLQTYNTFVAREREKEQRGDELLLHDELEAENNPVYFYQFAAHAADHGLQYLVEADFPRVVPTNLPPQAAQGLFKMAGDVIEMEQYMDFLRNRTFRQTLLCHQDVSIRRRLQSDPQQLSAFYVATYARPVSADPDIDSADVEKFRGPDGAVLSTDHPVTKAAMMYLDQISPRALAFDTLLEEARQRVYVKGVPEPDAVTQARDAETLAANILKAISYSMRLVELHVDTPDFTLQAGQRPVASAVARLQAQEGSAKVASLRHERVKLDQISRYLLPYLDGNHDRAMLLDRLMILVEEGKIGVEEAGERVVEAEAIRQIMAQELESTLRWLGRAALLEA